MANIKIIARKAGVSISTVSRVMNGSKPVSPELHQRVMDVVEQMNYKPNSIARSLILNKTNLIGVVVPDVSNAFQAQLLKGIEGYAARANYDVIICNVYKDLNKQRKYFNIMLDRHVDGIILLHEASKEELEKFFQRSTIPLLLSSVQVEDVSIPFVGIDEEKAGYDAASYLIARGHRSIGLIYGEGRALGTLRREGYMRALQENDLPVAQELMVQGVCSTASGYQGMRELLKLPSRPTAVFCVSDEMAIGALDCTLDQGLSVPEDISIMGFDDIDLSQVVRPKLSTVHQPIEKMGIESAKLLIKLIDANAKGGLKGNIKPGIQENPPRIILPHGITERQTVIQIKS